MTKEFRTSPTGILQVRNIGTQKWQKKCTNEGCDNGARGGTDKCSHHGGGKRCTTEGCDKSAQGGTEKCSHHGGGKRCTIEGCDNGAAGSTDKCIHHGGGKRCTIEGCDSGARGGTDKCIYHGGGKRCTIEGCDSGARGGTDKCSHHGGGKRCTIEGCDNGAAGGTDKCIYHGGGKRCTIEGCDNSAQGGTDKCIYHGGGKRCTIEGCDNSAQGGTDKCINHGGGKRCEHADHIVCELEPFPPSALFKDENGMGLCWQHYHSLVLGNNTCRSIRRELLFLGAVLCHEYRELELRDHYIGSDFNVCSCNLQRRPDMIFKFNEFVLLIEFDNKGHRDRKELSEIQHLAVISRWVNEKHELDHLHVIRVNPDGRYPMYKRIRASNGEVAWTPTPKGEDKTREFLLEIRSVIDAGLDETPLLEKDVDDDFEYNDDVLMRITTRWFY